MQAYQFAGRSGGDPVPYRFVVRGDLRDRFPDAFRGLSTRGEEGLTVISGDIIDQAQLIGVIVWLGDCGVEIISVTPAGKGLS
ncbi:hypothetical protein [Nocardioides sp. P5_C9_2]